MQGSIHRRPALVCVQLLSRSVPTADVIEKYSSVLDVGSVLVLSGVVVFRFIPCSGIVITATDHDVSGRAAPNALYLNVTMANVDLVIPFGAESSREEAETDKRRQEEARREPVASPPLQTRLLPQKRTLPIFDDEDILEL
jgi:hypothetical protein